MHAVNYNVPLVGEIKDGSVIPVENLSVRTTVPAGWEIRRVRAIEPGVSPQTLTFKAEGRLLEIVLPTIVFYKMIDISAAGK